MKEKEAYVTGNLQQNLLSTFREIDERISGIHAHSSEVFLQLNKYLKEYHKKSKTVYENASNIYSTIVGSDETNTIKDLNQLVTLLRSFRENTGRNSSKTHQELNAIIEKVNLSIVQTRNFKQDLLTLGYLIANYKFVANYHRTNETSKDFLDEINNWDEQSRAVRRRSDELENNLCDLRNHLLDLKHRSESRGEYSLTNIEDLIYSIETVNQVIQKKNKESKLSFPVLKDRTDSTTESIGNIITHLQYHDIIRQKIEHVQRTHNNIVKELQESPADSAGNGQNEHSNHQIADIVGLQAAQLIMVSKEYQNAIEVITSNFQRIANDIREISVLSSNFSYDEHRTDTTLLKNIKDKLDEGIILLDQSDSISLSSDIDQAAKNVATIIEKAKKEVVDPLFSLGKKFADHKSDKENENSLNAQISGMVRDILDKSKNLSIKLFEIGDFSTQLAVDEDKNEMGSGLEQERITLMVKISKILRTLDVDNSMLDTVLSQNQKLNKEILNRIESTINRVEYYMLFEEALNEVILNLNSINKELRPEMESDSADKVYSDLGEIEKLYTVKSERIVHRSVTGTNEDRISDGQESDEDLELF